MVILPPVAAGRGGGQLGGLLALTWLNIKRVARGWRWRSFCLVSLGAAYWFSRAAGFGEGSAPQFPSGAWGVFGFSVFFALSAAVLGVDSLGQWDRRRARSLLDTHMVRPFAFLFSNLIPIVLLGAVPVAAVGLWPVIGAWRAGLYVLWWPTWVYLAATGLPLLFCGAAAGLFARTLVKSDLAALAVAWALLIPVLAFRLVSAPASEAFLLASESLGILIPEKTLIREALVTVAHGLLYPALAAMLLPLPRARSAQRASGRSSQFDSPTLRRAINRVRLQVRQWRRGVLAAAVVPLVFGGLATGYIMAHLPGRTPKVDWNLLREPPGIIAGEVPPVRILNREIRLPDNAGGPLDIKLTIAPIFDDQGISAITFGPTLEILAVESAGDIKVTSSPLDPRAENAVKLLHFSPPLSRNETITLDFTVAPNRRTARLWERAYHSRYRRFSFLDEWYGESAVVSFRKSRIGVTNQDAPFVIDAPDVSPLTWFLGGAATHLSAKGRVTITQPLNDSPSRLIAGTLQAFPPTNADDLNVTFLLLPGRKKLGGEFHKIYAEQLTRIVRTFGQPIEPLYVYEVPEYNPREPLAISSSELDLMESLLPRYNDYERPTRDAFHQSLAAIHRGLVQEIITKNFSAFEQPALLRDGLIDYLDRNALGSGRFSGLLKARRLDEILIPWPFLRRNTYPYDVKSPDKKAWAGPAFPEMRSAQDTPATELRYAAFHHMIRLLLGDDRFRTALHDLMQSRRNSPLTVDVYRDAMEAAYGEPLGWFFQQWLIDGVLPDYRIEEAQAFLIANPQTRALEYRTKVRIANVGTGRMPVPWIMVTEGEPLTGKEWLDSGQRAELDIRSLDRPVAFEIDPDGWIAQLKGADRQPADTHPRVYFKTVTQL